MGNMEKNHATTRKQQSRANTALIHSHIIGTNARDQSKSTDRTGEE